MSSALPYKEFYYPLNVFMHILTAEEGGVRYLHYGLFEDPNESIGTAQDRSTELLFSRLPDPPASILEVGIGLATTLKKLTERGYDVEGITPDEKQIAMVRARYGGSVRAHCAAFETFHTQRRYDLIVFQESSQYIQSDTLFAKATTLSDSILVLDEFAMKPLDAPGLHQLDDFLTAAARHNYELYENVDLSSKAAPTMQYFATRIPQYRDRLVEDLGLTHAQLDALADSGARYRELYADGVYTYRLLRLARR